MKGSNSIVSLPGGRESLPRPRFLFASCLHLLRIQLLRPEIHPIGSGLAPNHVLA